MKSLIETKSYLESVAYGLLLFAFCYEKFKQYFIKTLYEKEVLVSSNCIETIIDPQHYTFFMPRNYLIAKQKLDWVINEFGYIESEEKESILKILNSINCKKHTQPKNGFWGFTLGEDLGPTIGIIDFAPKIEYSQIIILKPTCDSLDKYNLTKLINNASMNIIYKCIEFANYNLKRLEPEVISWLSDSRMLELYCAMSDSQYENIFDRIKKLEIKHSVVTKNYDSSVIALQPSMAGTYYEFLDGLIRK